SQKNRFEGDARLNFLNDSDGDVAREDFIHAAGDDLFADIHFVVVGDIFHAEQRLARTNNRTLNAGLDEQGARSTVFVSEKKNLGVVAIDLDNFSDRAIGSDDGHIAADPVALSAVDFDGAAGGAGAGSDDAGAYHGYVLVRGAKIKKFRQAVGFDGFALQLRDGQLQRVIFPRATLHFRAKCSAARNSGATRR